MATTTPWHAHIYIYTYTYLHRSFLFVCMYMCMRDRCANTKLNVHKNLYGRNLDLVMSFFTRPTCIYVCVCVQNMPDLQPLLNTKRLNVKSKLNLYYGAVKIQFVYVVYTLRHGSYQHSNNNNNSNKHNQPRDNFARSKH